MCEKDARTRNREWCHCAILLIAKFWLIAKMFQTDFANNEFLASFPLLLRFLHHFSPKNPNFDPPTSRFVPKCCLYVYVHKRHSKLYRTWNQNIISTQFTIWTIFHKNPQEQRKFIGSYMIMITHGITHQQQHLTTTTTTNHEFINNSSTTTLYFINFEWNHKVYIYTHLEHVISSSTT